MHYIQMQILRALMLAEKARYSDIKPAGVGGNHFAYHIKDLMQRGLVVKEGERYALSGKGLQLADRMSMKLLKARVQPKIVTLTVCRRKNGRREEILMCVRRKQPYIGKLSLPGGKIHLGERLNEAAARDLFEKTGLRARTIRHRGDAYIVTLKNGALYLHTLYHVFEGTPENVPPAVPGCRWIPAAALAGAEVVPGVLEILSLLRQKKYFFAEKWLDSGDT